MTADEEKPVGYLDSVFEAYRPFRNAIMSYPVEDSLATVRAYSQNLASNVPFPSDLEVVDGYKDMSAGVKQWELEIIAREVIAHSPRHVITGKTLRRKGNFGDILNRLRSLENKISGLVINQSNVLNELHRIAHRQFEWQESMPDALSVLRHYKIFGSTEMTKIVTDKVGLDTKTIYSIGLHLAGVYLKWFALHYPPTISITKGPHIDEAELKIFLEHFSIDITKLQPMLKDELRANMNERYAYFFDSLRSYPIVRMNAVGRYSLVAPLPTLLVWRFTRGLYYEIYDPRDHSDFDKHFGSALEEYIGEALKDMFGNSRAILPEEPTANDRGVSSSDWFLIDDKSVLFVESKGKRMGLAAKESLTDTTALEAELGKLADGIKQLYKCIDAVNNGKLAGVDYEQLKDKTPYPVVVTLESWHIFGPTWEKLNELVKVRLSKENLPLEWLETMPFVACNISEFEYLIQAIEKAGSIAAVLEERSKSKEFIRFELYSYLFNQKKEHLKGTKRFFGNQFAELFITEEQGAIGPKQ